MSPPGGALRTHTSTAWSYTSPCSCGHSDDAQQRHTEGPNICTDTPSPHIQSRLVVVRSLRGEASLGLGAIEGCFPMLTALFP